jgi:membrane-associated HD superfamily phosphohydrolase
MFHLHILIFFVFLRRTIPFAQIAMNYILIFVYLIIIYLMMCFIKWNNSRMKFKIPNLVGKNVVITGTSTGIGQELTKLFIQFGANVYTGDIDINYTQQKRCYANNQIVQHNYLDLGDLTRIEQFCDSLPNQIHYLVFYICIIDH